MLAGKQEAGKTSTGQKFEKIKFSKELTVKFRQLNCKMARYFSSHVLCLNSYGIHIINECLLEQLP